MSNDFKKQQKAPGMLMQMRTSSTLNNSSAKIVCNNSHEKASFCSDRVDEIPTLRPIREQQNNNIISSTLCTIDCDRGAEQPWQVECDSLLLLPPGQKATRIL